MSDTPTPLGMRRPTWDPSGRVVVRVGREVRLSKVYAGGDEIDVAGEGLTTRHLSLFWEQGLVDTLPPAPAPQSNTPPQTQRRK